MESSSLAAKTNFSECKQTTVIDDLLEALLVNKRRIYKNINPITSNGHGRSAEAKHVLTYILTAALGVHRFPWARDLIPDRQHFQPYSHAELRSAIDDARRIYEFGQAEMLQISPTMLVRRGLRAPESSVAATLLEHCAEKGRVRLPLQTITFFNHVCSAFSGEIELQLDVPVQWVWASIYTLKDLELPGSDEEVFIVCPEIDGCVDVPKSAFVHHAQVDFIEVTGQKAAYEECLARLFSAPFRLMPTLQYVPGPMESHARRLDKWIGRRAKVKIGVR
ncbi:hypothetical protein FQY83_17440 [Luteimonas marina]|uniref:Uncharacterized protein n=1 Tax=Luteimonas marina TaxID=488485 RepID=A0A5C5TS42_9GAMM|nr:hypothetical protein [Luteimonas marina]TWT17121.1 hypothetical protein FQY83_17440 [Luteimonas marina]